MNTIAILQARMSSSRLQGKVLQPILGVPMLFRQIERLRRCKEIDSLIVATSISNTDDDLAAECEDRGIECFRGSLDDVLERFYQAANKYIPDLIVRLTGDCPLADPELIDNVVRYYIDGDYDYVCNCDPPTFPDGLDVEVMSGACLKEAYEYANLPSEREHVTLHIRSNPDKFKIGNYASLTDLSNLRWTVDEPEDFLFVEEVYKRLYGNNPAFTTEDILRLIDQDASLAEINKGYIRNEGLLKSLEKDKNYYKEKQ